MMKIRRLILAILGVVGVSVWAATDSTFTNSKGAAIKYNSKGDIVRGEWTSQFNKARKQAESEGVPLVVFWANEGCSHCAAVELAMDSSAFRSWMKTQKLYMVFACGGNSGPCGKTDLNDGTATAKSYAKDPSGEFPYIGVWWNNGGTKLKQQGTFTGNGKSIDQIEKGIMNLLKGYKPSVGGWFADAESGLSRYEIEPTTEAIELILTRDSANKSAGDDEVKLSKTVNGVTSVVKTYKATWAKNATTTSLIVAVPAGLKAGDTLKAVINGETKAVYNCTIYCVAAKENSASNPDWGENVAFGVWTANFAGATNMVAKSGTGAYTLVSVQGSMWCPDCANTERNFLDITNAAGQNAFCKWAKSKNVALVAMDIPNYSASDPNGTATPSLFSRDAVATALARAKEYPQSGADESLTNKIVRSGLSYLTRKGISSVEAAATKELFHTLASKNTDEGGFHRPEDGNKYRTGVPIFVLLRKDGTVAARLTRLAAVSPMAADQANFDNYIRRLEEMLAIADADKTEIGNNYPSSDSIALKLDGTATKSEISNADFQDSFKLEGFNGAAVVTAKVSSDVSTADVIAQFMQKVDGAFVNIGKAVTGKLSAGGFEVTGEFTSSGACYLLVKGADITSADFKVESANSTRQAFAVSARVASLNPQQAKSAVPVVADQDITLNVTSGCVYRIVGGVPAAGYFSAEGRADLYTANVTGDAKVHADVAGTLEYQEWMPATVGFEVATETKGESVGTVRIKVLRRGGVSGKVSATVVLDKAKTTFYYDHDDKALPRFSIDGKDVFVSKELVWEDGDDDAKELAVELEKNSEIAKYFGDGKIALSVVSIASDKDDAEIDPDLADYSLNVKDESTSTKCTISILGTEPAWDYKAVAYVRKSAGLDIELARSDEGDVRANRILVKSSTTKAVVKAGAGNTTYTTGSQYWEANDYTNKILHVNLSKMSAGSSATITLASEKDKKNNLTTFAVDSSSKQVKVVALDDAAPSFVASKIGTFKYVTYSYCNESVAFDTAFVKNASKLSVKLVKGSLPTGVKASVSGGKLCFKGVPTKAGGFTAYYQAQEKRGTKTVKGLVVKASFRIVDPVTVSPTDATYGYLANTAVKSSRTFNGLSVLVSDGKATRVAGTLNVTIPKSGKISAKYVGRNATVSFSASRWAKKSFDDPDGTLSCKVTKSGYTLFIKAYPDGKVIATINDPLFPDRDFGAITAGKVWSSSASAKAWKGLYNAVLVPGGSELSLGSGEGAVALSGGVVQPTATNASGVAVFSAPTGYGYVNFKMTTKTAYQAGKMTWAGKLANGQAISGTAYLTKGVNGVVGRSGYAYLPVFVRVTEADKKSKDLIALVAEIQDNAASEGGLRFVQGSPDLYPVDEELYGEESVSSAFPLGCWEHTGVSGTGMSYSMDLHLFGSYYDPEKDLRACCQEQKVPVNQILQIVPPVWVGSTSKKVRVEAEEIDARDLKVGKSSIADESEGNPNRFTVKLNRETGVITGKIRVYTADGTKLSTGKDYVEATWAGVMTTGWGADCGCLEDDSLTLPFICGALSFKDDVSYLTSAGLKMVKEQLSGGLIHSGAQAE